MAFDFKKEYKEFYLPLKKPGVITVPAMNYVAVRGSGDPNEEGGAYSQAIGILYAISYTIKMSYKGDHAIDGFLNTWFLHSGVFGGSQILGAWTTQINQPSIGYRLSVCPTLLRKRFSTGR